jgi:UDPglucose 6-dehydrogenase
MSEHPLIGFIGQGFIGKNYADDFENRGFKVIRYSQELEYVANREAIATCDFVFIAVPTPTTPQGFDDSILASVLSLVGIGKAAIIKSTIVPGTCESLQAQYPDRFIFHSPEFLTEKTAAFDAAHPTRNIIGYPIDSDEYRAKAEEILDLLPAAPLRLACQAKEAELVKYAANCFLFLKVIYANILYDLAAKEGSDWEHIKAGMASDPRIGASHLDPVHASGTAIESGRGAGGHCFVKDFAAFLNYARGCELDLASIDFLAAAEAKNLSLLNTSGKDADIIASVYGQS